MRPPPPLLPVLSQFPHRSHGSPHKAPATTSGPSRRADPENPRHCQSCKQINQVSKREPKSGTETRAVEKKGGGRDNNCCGYLRKSCSQQRGSSPKHPWIDELYWNLEVEPASSPSSPAFNLRLLFFFLLRSCGSSCQKLRSLRVAPRPFFSSFSDAARPYQDLSHCQRSAS